MFYDALGSAICTTTAPVLHPYPALSVYSLAFYPWDWKGAWIETVWRTHE